ncbi:MAG: HD domain-containing protein [Bacteroidota bacterium]
MSTIERAIEIAARAHSGQLDKAGEPYIMHPLRVMFAVESMPEKITAVLHDVVEDSEITPADLLNEGFSSEIVRAVDLLTKRGNETRVEAGKRAAGDPVALKVKLADLADNMQMSRIANPTSADVQRMKDYETVRSFLLSVLSEVK